MTLTRRHFCSALAPAAALAVPAWAQAPRFPTKPITFVVPAPAGGSSDVIARLIAERLAPVIGQPVVVDNKSGAAQTLGTGFVARAEADGHTLLFTTSTPLVIAPFTHKSLPYDMKRDFTMVTHIGSTPLLLYAHPSLPVSSLTQLLAYARSKKPEELNYGSYGNGSSAHLMGELLNKNASIKLLHVPYKGTAPMIQDLVAGIVQLAICDIGVPAQFVKAGKLKPLAITGTARSPALPEVGTFGEQGVDGMQPFAPWWGVLAPAATPRPIVELVSAEIVKIVKTPDVQSRFAAYGLDATGTTPELGQAMLNADLAQWQKIVAGLPGLKFD
jgi:tripartite-type tricarboxylate transporter receptor subunit TctC